MFRRGLAGVAGAFSSLDVAAAPTSFGAPFACEAGAVVGPREAGRDRGREGARGVAWAFGKDVLSIATDSVAEQRAAVAAARWTARAFRSRITCISLWARAASFTASSSVLKVIFFPFAGTAAGTASNTSAAVASGLEVSGCGERFTTAVPFADASSDDGSPHGFTDPIVAFWLLGVAFAATGRAWLAVSEAEGFAVL